MSPSPGRRAFITGTEAHLADPPSEDYGTLFEDLVDWLADEPANPNAPRPVTWNTDNDGQWTAYLGWNGLGLVTMAETGGSAFQLNSDEFGILNQNVLGPTPDGWLDIGCRMIHLEIQRGASVDSGALTRYEAGIATMELDNTDLAFEPTNSEGPFFQQIDLGTTIVVMAVNVQVIRDLIADPSLNPWDHLFGLFKGTIDEWLTTGYETERPRAVLSLVDDVPRLQSYDGPELAPQGAGDTTEARLNRILAEAGWSTRTGILEGASVSEVVFPATGSANPTHIATTLAQPAWEMMLRVADSASRSVFVSGQGLLVATPISPTTQLEWELWSWGCDDGQIPIVGVDVEFSKEQLVNIVDAARTGGTQLTVEDQNSIARHGAFRTGRNDLTLEDDVDVRSFAGLIVNWAAEPRPRVTRLKVSPSLFPSEDFTVDFLTEQFQLVDLQVNAVAMVVGDPTTLTDGDQLLFDRLDGSFDTVDVFDDSTPDDGTISEATYAALVITDSVDSVTVGTKWLDWNNSVLVCDFELWADHQLAANDGFLLNDRDSFLIPDPPLGWQTLRPGGYSYAEDLVVGHTISAADEVDIPAEADIAARDEFGVTGFPQTLTPYLWVFDTGALRVDGTSAPARRAAIGALDSHLAVGMTASWFRLFDDLMAYLVPSIFVQEIISTPGTSNAWRGLLEFADWLGSSFISSDVGLRNLIDVPIPGNTQRITDTVAIRGMMLELDDSTVEMEFVTSSISQFLDVFILNDPIAGVLNSGHVVA